MLSFFAQKIEFWQKSDFVGVLAKIFNNKKLIKNEKYSPRYMYLDDFGKFLMIFVKKYFSVVQKILVQKAIFGDFSKMQFLGNNLTV